MPYIDLKNRHGETVARTRVDEDRLEELICFHWRLMTIGYVIRHTCIKGELKVFLMHRQLMGFPKLKVDHINGDRLDNRMCNLRSVTNTQNAWNKKFYSRNKVGMKGVRFDGRAGRLPRYTAQIGVDGKQRFLGSFDTAEAAAAAYRKAAEDIQGEFLPLAHRLIRT